MSFLVFVTKIQLLLLPTPAPAPPIQAGGSNIAAAANDSIAQWLGHRARVETITILGGGEAERPKFGSRELGGRDRAAHELGRAKNWEQVTESWKRAQKEEGRAEGKDGIYGRRESSEATVHAPSLIRRLLNLGFKHYRKTASRGVYTGGSSAVLRDLNNETC